MRCYFLAERCIRIFCLQKGYGDQLTSNIAGIITEEPQS
jgi:hypothetical protein